MDPGHLADFASRRLDMIHFTVLNMLNQPISM